ncbi:serine hydroxymethyltransferase [Yinghuangia soli]|uniref:Serine hydroxymethyltransferase n=1 Tax=Yinghuangia soli TaxID=2908204 RepID=A0AA41U417_9ACTN|nr:serine hydroxymethyltransferase [Yinghuangia soli]MCF2532410.1 serine hydroxymethyltransferase [Yinghuangia soli]
MSDAMTLPLAAADPQIHALLAQESHRRLDTLDMTAAEGCTPAAVLEAEGTGTARHSPTVPSGRRAEDPGFRDRIEALAIERARHLFGAEHADVRLRSGAHADAAALSALLDPGGTVLGLDRAHGGRIDGDTMDVAGRRHPAVAYRVDARTHWVDMDDVARLAERHRPQVVVAGWSAYTRHLDFAAFRAVADAVGARLMVDMAHFAGLVAAGVHPSPVPYADVVTATTHTTLDGPRGGLVLGRAGLAARIGAAVSAGLEDVAPDRGLAAKAVAFKLAAGMPFAIVRRRAVDGARIIAERLARADMFAAGVRVLTGGTDVHLVLLDLRACRSGEAGTPLHGRAAEERLHGIGITVECCPVPYDPRPASAPSGVRIDTTSLAARGFGATSFVVAADILAEALSPGHDTPRTQDLRTRVTALSAAHPH